MCLLVYIYTENYHINHIASVKNRRSLSQQTAGPLVLKSSIYIAIHTPHLDSVEG